MRYRKPDVIARALDVLDRHGLADLTMRRLGAELDVRPSALYHHFPDKQTLLAAVADELLGRGDREVSGRTWHERVEGVCVNLRDALLAYPDGAELVATVRGFGLGGAAPYDVLCGELAAAGLDDRVARAAASTLVHYVLGHTFEEQTQLQARSAGAVAGDPLADDRDFAIGLGLILDGIEGQRVAGRVPDPSVATAT